MLYFVQNNGLKRCAKARVVEQGGAIACTYTAVGGWVGNDVGRTHTHAITYNSKHIKCTQLEWHNKKWLGGDAETLETVLVAE